ncbi:BppU family phage baseplate upper protein [Bacillus paranthracis]|uniref:BppU family phage baseplate upper protein n=1 Tax=Bacillus paranthracis TaxID=2026186 RepID=UPI0021D3A8A9|nr:BppU family phage baseplate upper protein [Bacillus paranthracis]MCU5297017.1 BppU family phage baseplate upper protein [Bacillus paranthracis]
MNNQSYEITVDTQKSINHSNIEFSQNNLNISELIFNITEDGKELPLNDTDEIIVYFKKPDKTVVFQDKEIELLDKTKGKIKVLLTTQTLVKAGDVEGEISIGRVENGTKKRTSTYGFSFKVRSSLASNDSIESTNEFQMFDQLLELGKQDIPAIIASKETAEQALKKSDENANQIGILSENVTNNTTDLTKQRITVNRPALELNSVSSQIPMVTFIDDDGTLAVQTKLKPLAIEKKIPFTLAIVSDFMMGLATDGGLSPAGFMNVSQVRDLYKNYGFEIQSHSATHLAIGSLADKEQWYEIKSSYEKLNQLGFDVEYLIYPYGSNNKAAREKVSKYYKGAIGTSNGLNVPPVSTFGLKRVPFGSFTEGQNSLDFYKSKVDEAIANNQWLIFMLHVGNPEHDATQQQHLSDLIDYIKTKPIKIATVKEGYEIYGNLIDYNDQEIYFSKLGKNNIKDFIRDPLDPKTGIEKYNFSKKPNEFERGKVFNTNVYNDNANSPSGARGMLTTYTQDNDGTEAYQTFSSKQKIYERHSTSSTAWGPWRRRFIAEESTALSGNFGDIPSMGAVTKDLTINNLAAGNPVILTPTTDFPKGIMFSYTITAGWILTVTLFNVTGAPITVGTKTFNALVMK